VAIITVWVTWFTLNVVSGEDMDEAERIRLVLSPQALLPEIPDDSTDTPRGFQVVARGPNTQVFVSRVTDSREQEAFLAVVREATGRVAREPIVVTFYRDAVRIEQRDPQGLVRYSEGRLGELLRTETIR
jgi:hypothetical protein